MTVQSKLSCVFCWLDTGITDLFADVLVFVLLRVARDVATDRYPFRGFLSDAHQGHKKGGGETLGCT
jgi:hypothetical protein